MKYENLKFILLANSNKQQFILEVLKYKRKLHLLNKFKMHLLLMNTEVIILNDLDLGHLMGSN